jgi:hypothetical protein
LSRGRVPTRHRADKLELLRCQVTLVLVTAPDYREHLAIAVQCGLFDRGREAMEIESGGVQHTPQRMDGGNDLARLIGAEEPQKFATRRSSICWSFGVGLILPPLPQRQREAPQPRF